MGEPILKFFIYSNIDLSPHVKIFYDFYFCIYFFRGVSEVIDIIIPLEPIIFN